MAHTLKELIAAFEQSNGSDQVYLIQSALELARDKPWISEAVFRKAVECLEAGGSLDAALSLVPEGCFWYVGAGKTREDEPLFGTMVQEAKFDGVELGIAETDVSAALALCLAALKARAAKEK